MGHEAHSDDDEDQFNGASPWLLVVIALAFFAFASAVWLICRHADLFGGAPW